MNPQGEVNVLRQLRSMKRYLLLDTGDFFVHFLDLASTELAKPGYKVDYVKLNALLQVCCVALYCVRETACVHACSACVYVLGAALTNILAFVCPQLPLSLSLSPSLHSTQYHLTIFSPSFSSSQRCTRLSQFLTPTGKVSSASRSARC